MCVSCKPDTASGLSQSGDAPNEVLVKKWDDGTLSSVNQIDDKRSALTQHSVTEGLPFNDTALVFKVAGKMFAVLDQSENSRGITLKCDPELAIELRERHSQVTAAWHFNQVI